jgi:uncharacterized coiled-coil protein SlyX
MSADHNPQSQQAAERLARLEESLAFTERAVEQLSEEIATLGRAVRDVNRRIAALEDRLGKALEKPSEDEEREP